MIEVLGVQPNARELRALRRGWGLVHWVGCAPYFALWAGLFLLVYFRMPTLDAGILLAVLIGTLVLWWVTQLGVHRVMKSATRSAPAGGTASDWRLDEEGVRFASPLYTTAFHWAAVKGVQEEKDRFVFLILPATNPVLPKRRLTDEQLAALRTLIADVRASGRLGAGVD